MKLSILYLPFLIILFWGLWGFLSKIAVEKIHLQVAFWSSISVMLIISIYLFFTRQLFPLKWDTFGVSLAILGGVCAGLASILFYILLGKKPVGLIIIITALYPLVTLLLAIVFLKEPLSQTKIIGFLLALAALIFLNL